MIKKYIKYISKIFLITFIITNLFLFILSKHVMPSIMNYVNYEMKKSTIEVLRSTGLRKINELLDKNDLYVVNKNGNENLDIIDFNVPLLNELLIVVAKETRDKLVEENSKNNVLFVPLGIASNNVIISNTGPKIPVKIEYKGNVGLDLKSRVKPYGIDSAIIEIYIRAEVTQVSIIPFIKKSEKVYSDIPVAIKVIKGTQGNVLINKSSNYSLPIN